MKLPVMRGYLPKFMTDLKQLAPIAELKEWDRNPRTIDRVGFERLKAQINRVKEITGEYLYKPLLITPDNVVIGGNMRLRVLRDLGVDKVWVNVINVKNEQEMIEIALSDNDQAGKTEKDLLLELIEQYPQIKLSDYAVNFDTPTTLDDFMNQFKEVVEDEVPEVSDEPAVSILGEVYQLGRHRLMCGDATKIEDVEKLMDGKKANCLFTDPPYNVNLEYNLIKDNKDPVAYKIWCWDWFSLSKSFTKNQIVFVGNTNNKLWIKEMNPDFVGIWDKGDGATTHGSIVQYTAWEPIFFHGKFERKRHTDIFRYVAGGEKVDHVCPKPVKLIADIIENFIESSALDLFGGSGSTLIASEQTNRTCYILELDEKYIDVIRKRWAKYVYPDRWEQEWEALTPAV